MIRSRFESGGAFSVGGAAPGAALRQSDDAKSLSLLLLASVELHVANVNVVGSNPITRFRITTHAMCPPVPNPTRSVLAWYPESDPRAMKVRTPR